MMSEDVTAVRAEGQPRWKPGARPGTAASKARSPSITLRGCAPPMARLTRRSAGFSAGISTEAAAVQVGAGRRTGRTGRGRHV